MATIKLKFLKKPTYIKVIANNKIFIVKFDEFKVKAKEIVDFLNMKQTDNVNVTSPLTPRSKKWTGNSEPLAFFERTFEMLLNVGAAARKNHLTWGDVSLTRDVASHLDGEDYLKTLSKE